MSSLAALVESALEPSGRVVLDDRRLPLFELGRRLRDGERSAFFHAKVVDEELLAQGAPPDVVLHLLSLAPETSPAVLARALEPCLVDHPRLQLVHSVALPLRALAAVQPAEPSPILPPLNTLPICDELGVIALVQEWSEGTPLLTWRQQRGAALKLGDVSDLLETASEALAALHRRGFAHGALTPESLVLQEFDAPQVPGEDAQTVFVPKIVDLGLSRSLAPAGTWPSGASALWCAPEAFAPDAMTDWRRVDQHALAAILYALWTDRVPFEAVPAGASPAEAARLRRRHIEGLPPPRGNPRARELGVTPAMSAACMRAMAAEPSERFPSMDAFASALRAAARDAGRRTSGADDEPGARDSTSPGSSISQRFRVSAAAATSGSGRLAVPDPSEERTEPPAPKIAKASAPEGSGPALSIAAVAQMDEITGGFYDRGFGGKVAQAAATAGSGPGLSIDAIAQMEEITGGFYDRGFGEKSGNAAAAGGSLPGLSIDAVAQMQEITGGFYDHGFHRKAGAADASDAGADPEAARRTKILAHPDEDDGDYPPHPDEDEDDEDDDAQDGQVREVTEVIDTQADIAAAFGARRWAFNHLAAVFLLLWLATAAFAFARGAFDFTSGPDLAADGTLKSAKGAKGAKAADTAAIEAE